ncbi:MAG: hypothetical protein WBC51_14675 [Vicinamibacterales bacterium]
MSILTLADLVVDATKLFTRCRRGVGDTVRMEYVSRVPRPPLDGLIDDLYYLEGAG